MTIIYINDVPMTSNGLVWDKGTTREVVDTEAQRLINTFKGWFTDSISDTEPVAEPVAEPVGESIYNPVTEDEVVEPTTKTRSKK